MKKWISFILSTALLLTVGYRTSTAMAAEGSSVTQIDVVTVQANGTVHPDQIVIERTLHPSAPQAERFHMTPVPAGSPYGMAAVAGSSNVYVTDRKDGSIWEMNPDSGQAIRHFAPSEHVSSNMEGIATGLGENLYVYYNSDGIIQRLKKDGTVVESFAAPTIYGHCLAYRDGYLYLLDDRGDVFQISTSTKQLAKKFDLKKPDGTNFQENESFTLNWDGKYWNVADAKDGWQLYRYDANWQFHDKVNLQQWSMSGCVFDGQEYLVLNNDNDRIFTIRYVDDTAGDVSQEVSDHYQYIGNLLTTTHAPKAFPQQQEHNIALLYNDPQLLTSYFLKPYVSYLNENGQRTDSMFDSFVFLPSGAASTPFLNHTDPNAWKAYLQKTIQDMTVLDQEWAAKNQDLNQTGQADVYLAVPDPSRSDDLSAREKAVHDYLDLASSLVHAKHFANLNFRGFYWYNEDANYGEPLVVDFNQYVHNKGLLTLWIPYQAAQEVSDYRALGFDEVYQQPNYYFKDEGYATNLNRFFNLTWTGARYGKGVEIEMDERIYSGNSDYRNRFLDYLHYGMVEGFLGGSKVWYDNQTIYNLSNSHDPLYDTIHQVIVGTYQDPAANVQTGADGLLHAQAQVSIPETSKIRLDVLARQPFKLQKVTLHTDSPSGTAMTFKGTLRVDEEMVVKNGELVKQEIGQQADSLRLGFNVPIDTPLQVTILPQNKAPYDDVAADDFGSDAINSLSDQGIVNGSLEQGQLLYHPQNQITRAEFAVLLENAYHLQAAHTVRFDDAAGQWFAGAVAAVTDNGLMDGYDSSHFGPNDPITEEQVATILVRVLHQQQIQAVSDGVQIKNQNQVSSWALSSVLEGKKLGLYDDRFGDTEFEPLQRATRAEVAQVLHTALGLKK